MNRRHVKYLIIGGGVAGSAAIEAIRRVDHTGSILFAGAESNRPYLRPAINKQYLRRGTDRSSLAALPVSWYAERHVELQTGQRVARLDTARFSALLGSGEEVSFDSALVAIGATSAPLKVAGDDLPGLHYLRTLDEADRLIHALDVIRVTRQPRVVIIGAGLIGLETAATLSAMGVDVHVVEGAAYPWRRIAGPDVGLFLQKLLSDQHVQMHVGHPVARLGGDGRVQRVVLNDGTNIACDLAIAAVGMTISRDLLRGTQISAETAILIDGRCQTSVRGIYAAGDCTAILDPLFGKHRVIDHVDHARLTGNIAGANMAGGDERYTQLSHYWSDIGKQRVDIWGESKLVYRHIRRGDPATKQFAEFGIAADDRIAQVIAVGRTAEHAALRFCVEKRLNVAQIENILTDESSDLASMM